MTINIIKLCVGVDTIDDLAQWQKQRAADSKKATGTAEVWHITRMVPKRQDELLDGGSIYWVIKGVIQVRQKVIGFKEGQKRDGTPAWRIILDPELVPVMPTPRRAFQGWRYLEPDEAPEDLSGRAARGLANLPPKMRRELAELGLL